ncbi:hypothetical protein CC86DRAFT_394111 [Ophiobolus disseminans]|uniref:DUF6604 domain-containing protein n=1 Tax=Ophiobolus disseminans TaxID=1469910 RepID=A0A6A7A3D9_9PLEO|nr:hypothetical protein CC86DRAFT_394111 [Ophiobolus disseminans]
MLSAKAIRLFKFLSSSALFSIVQSQHASDDIQTMFAHLEVEEPSGAFQNGSIAAPTASHDIFIHYQAERPDGLQEDFLAFHLLLSDLDKLRTEVERTWEGYKQGMYDLVVASITTNTAVDLARSLEQEYKDLFARRGGTDRMLAMFYQAQCAAANTTESFKDRPGDEMNFKMYETADAILWIPFLFVSSFLDVVTLEFVTQPKFHEDKILLMEVLPEFQVLTMGSKRSPAEDEMTRGLRTVFETKKVSLWLCLAVQLYLDIHNRLRDEVDRSFRELANVADFTRNNIKSTLDFHKDLRIDNWPGKNDEFMTAFSDEIMHWIISDPHRAAARQLKRKNLPGPYYFFRQHPWLCGLWKYYIQIQLQSTAIAFVNAWGSVMYCGHFYNAVRKAKLLPQKWSDMELAFAIRGYEDFFVGSPPSQPEDYVKRFLIALGGSAVNFAAKDKGRKKKGLVKSSRGPRSLRELAPVMQTFKERYCEANPRFDLRAEDVQSIVEQSEWQLVKAPTKKVTITQLVSILRAGLQAEIIELSFDYLTFHRFCWRLLCGIKDTCCDQLVQMYGPDYIEDENQLPFVVGYIFASATNTRRLAGFMKIKKTDEVTSKVVRDAAEVLQVMVEAGAGDMVLRDQLGIPFEFEDSDEDYEGSGGGAA